jgi:anti-sigma B factor antagonist
MASVAGVSDTAGDQLSSRIDAGGAGSVASPFLAVHERVGGWSAVRLASTLDASVAGSLRRLFNDLGQGGDVHVVVDLAGVAFIDSAGLGVLIGACRSLRALGGELRLAGARSNVCSLLRMTGISRMIGIYTSVEDAVGDRSSG